MTTAQLVVDPARPVGAVDRRLFGSFVEHLGRAVYDGIHEPGHPLADEHGFRSDVVELVRGLGVSAVRYPGGNFVSGFRWEDSVGPRDRRPRRLDLAWHSLETNQVGLHEFSHWLDLVGSELVLAVNLGTRGTLEALDLLEYANVPGGSALSELRAEHGRREPFGVRTWCLGNEMDGPWQLGHRSADDYGKLAARTASAMRQLDPSLELVACGSSSAQMPTFGEWERVVLGHTHHLVDFISCHAYYCLKDDLGSFLASAVDMDRFIETVVAVADAVGAEQGSAKRLSISFDEWNVWDVERYVAEDKRTAIDDWPVAPRILEDVYTVADAVVLGSLLICLLKHADRVTSACLAQLVNVIAPIMTEPGGPAWTQTTYVPFATTSRLARGQALAVSVDSGTYATAAYGEVPLVDAVATHDPSTGAVALFLVNRATDGPTTVEVDLARTGVSRITETVAVWDDDLTAANTLAAPDRVQARTNGSARLDDGRLRVELPPVSWTALHLA
jgi:alpha-N-arabinofuranosidase